MPLPRMYDDLAPLWALVSPPEEYAAEAVYWVEAIREHLGPGRHDVLELGCGGGHLMSHLTREFALTGVDLAEQMLANSRRLNPGVEHHVADMRSVRLGRRFDAVLIHDAISYLTCEDDVRATFATAASHLEPGGLLVCAPDGYRETFRAETTVTGPRGTDPEVTFVESVHDPDPGDTTIESVFVFVVRRAGVVEVIEDRHTLGLFPLATWLDLIEGAGFSAGRRPYPVHADGREAWLLTGLLGPVGPSLPPAPPLRPH